MRTYPQWETRRGMCPRALTRVENWTGHGSDGLYPAVSSGKSVGVLDGSQGSTLYVPRPQHRVHPSLGRCLSFAHLDGVQHVQDHPALVAPRELHLSTGQQDTGARGLSPLDLDTELACPILR